MRRVILDTNVLVADAYNRDSASARIVDACLDGRLLAVVSPQLLQEYEFILGRAVRVPSWWERYRALLACALMAEPQGDLPRVVAEDRSDDMLFATALAGGAEVVLTNDADVLRVNLHEGVRALMPLHFLGSLEAPPDF